jgi:hypothetical protein
MASGTPTGGFMHNVKRTNAKLNTRQVKAIRRSLANGGSIIACARRYKVHRETIRLIKTGRNWRGVA